MDLLKVFIEKWRAEIGLSAGVVVVACSGGIDSLALLDILDRLQGKLGVKLCAAHFEHGIRGEASVADAEFVREFCRGRGIECFMGAGDVPKEVALVKESLETAARRLRYAFLRRVCEQLRAREQSQTVVIATAHHADDQAETVLMHLLRGSGLKGLGGMRASQGDLIRPLLWARKADLAAYCRARGLTPRHDATNEEKDCQRNKIRLELLPLLEKEYNPAVQGALCQLANLAAADEDFLQFAVQKAWHDVVRVEKDGLVCEIEKLLGLHISLQRRLVQQMGVHLSGEFLPFPQVEAVLHFAQKNRTGSRLELAFNLVAKISYGILYILEKNISFLGNNDKMKNEESVAQGDLTSLEVQMPGVTVLPDSRRLVAGLCDKLPERNGSVWVIYGDWDKCPKPLCLRHRQKGDKVKLSHGSKKLKDFLIDRKIPQEERDKLWLLVGGKDEEILAVLGGRRFAVALAEAETKRFFVLRVED